MKITGILLMGILISCSVGRKSNTMKTIKKDKSIEAEIFKDTATWVDGRTYQFIELVINESNFILKDIDLEKNYATGMNEIYVSVDSTSSKSVFIPVKMNGKILFLTDDFDNYGKIVLSVLCVRHYSLGNKSNLFPEFISTTVEVNFEEIRNTKLPDIYPEADSAWYKKWKEENPNFKGKRERHEKNFYYAPQTPSVKPVKKEFFNNDTLSFVFDGAIRNDGGSQLKPLWGVLKRSVYGWDTLINVKDRVTTTATVPYTTFHNYKRDFIVVGSSPLMIEYDQLCPYEHFLDNDGEYMLTILSGDGKEVIYSEPFSISTTITIDGQLAEELRLSPDTIVIENNRLFLKDIYVWRDMMPVITNESSRMIVKGHFISDEKEALNGIILKKHYVVQDDRIWISDYNESEVRKPMHLNYIETVVRNGPKWQTNTIVDVICEFEYSGKIHRIIAKSQLIGGIQ